MVSSPSPPASPAQSGHRLLRAFEAFEQFPALLGSRDRLLELARNPEAAAADVVATVESDAALAVAVLRAGRRAGRRATTAPEALAALEPGELEALANSVVTFDFFDRTREWNAAAERFRLHALATQRAVEGVAGALGADDRDELLLAALLHDIGKLVLLHGYDRYGPMLAVRAAPDDRVRLERRELGIDHALVGGVLARRLGLPDRLAATIEHHHGEDAGREAAIVRLADMLVHYSSGTVVDARALDRAAETVEIGTGDLRALLFELPAGRPPPRRDVEPSPLSTRETQALRLLATGRVYRDIAAELQLSPSTVRSHLHSVYTKLGVPDRAQAVLKARERGWI